MSAVDWLGFTATLISVITSAAFGVKWLVKHYLSELKPNGGSSMKDKVNDIDTKVKRLETRVDQIYFLIVSDKNAK